MAWGNTQEELYKSIFMLQSLFLKNMQHIHKQKELPNKETQKAKLDKGKEFLLLSLTMLENFMPISQEICPG